MSRKPAGWRHRLRMAWAALAGKSGREVWKGAEVSRLTADWVTRPMTADQEVRGSIIRLRARARDLRRNSPVVRQYMTLLRGNVIGPVGMKLQAQVRNNDGRLAKRINDTIEAAFADWSRAVTRDGRYSLTAFQNLALASVATDGEVFVRLHRGKAYPHELALELVDPDLVDHTLNIPRGTGTNEVRMGVEVDSLGRRVAYYVWTKADSLLESGERRHERIPADQVLHLYMPERTNQTRGVTWLAAVMLPLRMLDGYVEAELVAARTAASKMGFFVQKDPAAGEVATAEDGSVTMEANPGTFDFAPAGYDLSSWSPDHPSGTFPDFVKASLRQVAAGLGVSYNALANDLEGVNYSSIRSGMLVERDTWRTLQEWWREAFLVPVYREWLAQSLLSGELKLDTRDPRRFQDVKFTARGWTWVDPAKDAAAGELAIKNGLTSRTRLLAEQGLDLEEVWEELKAEAMLAEDMELVIPGPGSAAGAVPEKEPEEPEEPGEEEPEEPGEMEPEDGAGAGTNGSGRGHLLHDRFANWRGK